VKADGVVFASEDIIKDIIKLKDVRAIQSDLNVQEEDLKGRIIIALGESGDILADTEGNALATYKMSKGRKSFDVKEFQKDHAELYEQYLKNGEGSRRFLLK
jgi:hypothetical protein